MTLCSEAAGGSYTSAQRSGMPIAIRYCARTSRSAEDPRAAQAYLAAARSQATEYRQEAALQLVERGLALAFDRIDCFSLMCLKGEILHDLGSMPEAGRAYQAALDAAADDRERCTAWIGLAAVKRVTDDLAGAVADLEQAEAAAMRHRLLAEQARNSFLVRESMFSARRPRRMPSGTRDWPGVGQARRRDRT